MTFCLGYKWLIRPGHVSVNGGPILCKSSAPSTQAGLEVQAESLAPFATLSQQAGLVPIVGPDVDFAEDADLKKSVEV